MSVDIKQFHTRREFDLAAWETLCSKLYYISGSFEDESTFNKLHELVTELDTRYHANGNVLYYKAVPPSVFSLISSKLRSSGLDHCRGWKRIIVEKPFGTDLASAREMNRELLSFWDESQIYRIDHYLGKETVQNILAFRFANGMFEHLWSKHHVDNIQFTVSESVSVEGRGGYYDKSGALRDMVQNHMLQMLSYVCMEPPNSFSAGDIRDEKAKLLNAVRVYTPEEAFRNSVRGQYGGGGKADGTICPDYPQEPGVNPYSSTETYAAMRLFIDNWRWEGVPIYLRTGKALWKRGTDVVVEFKKPPDSLFRGTAVKKLDANRLIFHIQPDQAIQSVFHAKIPGPTMQLQPVNMRFDYGEAFQASRGTGYEVMIYSCMMNDATLFSRTDLVETSWRIVQPMLDAWFVYPTMDFPNYPAGTWGPKAASDLIENDGRRWFEVVTAETLEHIPLLRDADPLFLSHLSMCLRPRRAAPDDIICRKGDPGTEMFLICRGEVEFIDSRGETQMHLQDGDCFGEIALLVSGARVATVRAKTLCDLFVLEKNDFDRILRDHPQFAEALAKVARERYMKLTRAGSP
jgi:glucose-6-phosphate 1-dehydrogenase